jgi:hypothetical protein
MAALLKHAVTQGPLSSARAGRAKARNRRLAVRTRYAIVRFGGGLMSLW